MVVYNKERSITRIPLALERNGKLSFVRFDSLHSSQHFFSHVRTGLSGLNQYKAEDKMSCSRTQCSASGEAQTRNPSVSSQAFYH